MHVVHLAFASQLVARINGAYRHRHLFCHVSVPLQRPRIWRFLYRLRRLGVIGHYERVQSSEVRVGARYGSLVRVRVYLRYVATRPAVKVWSMHTTPKASSRVTLESLLVIARTAPAAGVVLMTRRGWLTVPECLAYRCGGHFTLGFTLG